MRRTSSALLALALFAGLLGCPKPAAEVTVVLRPGEGVTLDGVKALQVLVRNLDEEAPEVFGPIPLERKRQPRLAALVPPGADFYVDVWACPMEAACAPDDLLARGCSSIENLPPGTRDAVIAIELYPMDDARAEACPPDDD